MFAHGLPLMEVEIQASASNEIVKSNLLKLEQEGLWEDLEEEILTHFPMVSKTSMDGLRESVRASSQRKSSFQSRSAKLRYEFHRKSKEDRDEFLNEIEEIELSSES